MKRKERSVLQSKNDRITQWVITFVLLLFCASVVIPFLNIIAVSLSGRQAVLSGKVSLFPVDFSIDAYTVILRDDYFFRAYGNTLFVVIVGTAISILLTTISSFIVSRKDLPGRKLITFLITLTMWFSGGMIPSFLLIRSLKLYDSLFALILPTAVSAYNVIIMRNFFDHVPPALEESAELDGANDLIILRHIFLPLSKPVIATVTLWIAVGYWNAYTPALLYLSTRSKFTLQLVLREIVFANTLKEYMDVGDTMSVISESIKYSNIILIMLPIMCVYPFLQKYFVKGVMIGAVKG